MDDERGAEPLELLGKVLEEARTAGLEAMIEAVVWRGGRMSRLRSDIVLAAVVAHDLGAPLLKVPVPRGAIGRRAGRRGRPGGRERRGAGPLPRRIRTGSTAARRRSRRPAT